MLFVHFVRFILDQRVLVVLFKDDVVLPPLLVRLRVGMMVVMSMTVTVTMTLAVTVVTVVSMVTMVARGSGRRAVQRKVFLRWEDRRPGDQAAVES